jgi:hypothetical protein
MPTYYPESIDIDIEEFVDDCDSSDIEELVAYLKSEGYDIDEHDIDGPIDVQESEWNNEIHKLMDATWKLTTEDEKTIREICAKLL